MLPYWKEFLSKFYFDSFHSFAAFVVFLVGLYFLFKQKDKYLKMAFGAFTLVFLLFAFKTGIVFPTHSYYIIPFTPIMAVIAGLAFDKIPGPYFGILLLIISVEGIANQQHDFFIKDNEKYKLKLEGLMNTSIGKKDKIVINGGTSPQHIYFANRKGWTNNSEIILSPNYLDSVSQLGAKFLIWDKNAELAAPTDYQVLQETKDYVLLDLTEKDF